MDDSHQEVDKECNPEAALEVGSISSVELDKVCPLLLPRRSQRRKDDHGDRSVAVKVERRCENAITAY